MKLLSRDGVSLSIRRKLRSDIFSLIHRRFKHMEWYSHDSQRMVMSIVLVIKSVKHINDLRNIINLLMENDLYKMVHARSMNNIFNEDYIESKLISDRAVYIALIFEDKDRYLTCFETTAVASKSYSMKYFFNHIRNELNYSSNYKGKYI